MSEENSQKIHTALFSLLPILILILLDSYVAGINAFTLKYPIVDFVSQFPLVVLASQWLILLVFNKGQICNGQRSRLIAVQRYFALFWLFALICSFFSGNSSIALLITYCCGLFMLLPHWQLIHGFEQRKTREKITALLGIIGLVSYLYGYFVSFAFFDQLRFNPISQMLAGLLLAQISLQTSRSRLNQFIAMLPMVAAILLAFNIFVLVAVLIWMNSQGLVFINEAPLGLYFVLHFIILALLGFHIWKKQAFSYNNLLLTFILVASLPMWIYFTQFE